MGRRGSGPERARSRSLARRMSLQALYQWQIAGQNLSDIDAQFREDQDFESVDLSFFLELLHQIPACVNDLNATIDPNLDRPAVQLDPVERAVLWIGTYELLHRPDVPYRVIINEAVDLAKTFGAEQGHRFVNGVLDRIAHSIRAAETSTS